ncbi:MAG: peptidoglycan DD-metalloendopeptidase family protein [Parvibaculum sp.]
MQDDHSNQSRFGNLPEAVSIALNNALTRAGSTVSETIAGLQTKRQTGAAGTNNDLTASLRGLQGRWSTASTAIGALSLGMATLAVGALVSPAGSTAVPVAAQQTNIRIVTTIAPVTLAPATIAAEADILDNQPTDSDVALSVAPLATDMVAHQAADETDASTRMGEQAVASLSPDMQIMHDAPIAASAPFTFQTARTLLTEDLKRTSHETVSVGRGDTLMQLLLGAGATRSDAHRAIAAMKPLYDPRKLRSGQELDLTFDERFEANENQEPELIRTLSAITMKTDVDREVAIHRTAEGKYSGLELIAELETGNVRARGTIDSSLFLAAAQAGIPATITVEMIRMYSYDIDFQRDIRQGDSFEVLFSREYDDNGTPVREGNVLYASMTVGGKERALWRHDPGDGNWDYFDEQGRSMKKFLMKTPIDGARISSGFGNRRHPILGYTRLHSGTDFAAPTGTPIYAAGNGTIEVAGRNGSYGNYVRIRHANGYQTAYAHMNSIGRGIRQGSRVRQGEVIGYVGTTGRSTGPHLHYEVMHNGNKVNPQTIRVPTGRSLGGRELTAFQTARTNIETLMAAAPSLTRVAEADIGN